MDPPRERKDVRARGMRVENCEGREPESQKLGRELQRERSVMVERTVMIERATMVERTAMVERVGEWQR